MSLLETRRPQVRATPTGISAILDARGEALAEADFHERTGLVADVPIAPAVATLSLRYGDWLGPVLLLVGALLWFAPARPRRNRTRRQRSRSQPSR